MKQKQTLGFILITGLTQIILAGSLNPPVGPVGPTMKPLDEIEPRTAVQTLAGSDSAVYVISQPGSYYLTAGVTVTELKHAISIETSNVMLDLSGFSITGAYQDMDAAATPAYDGIHINSGYTNIVIRNGIIDGHRTSRRVGIPPKYIIFYTIPFARGIGADWDISASPRLICEAIQVRDVIVRGSQQCGIYLKGTGHFISGCTAEKNEGPGIHAGFPSTVKNNHQSGNGDTMQPVENGGFAYHNATSTLDWIDLSDYYLAAYETTNAEYCDFLNEADGKGQYFSSLMEINRTQIAEQYVYSVQSGKENYPIRYTTAYDAEAYAKWKSRTTGQCYRLPTEQEWEKAAGWNPVQQKMFTYAFQQDVIDSTWCNYNDAYSGPLPVGSFNGTGGKNEAKSWYGCYDMSGNVSEWTSTAWPADTRFRVQRGGSWNGNALNCTVTGYNNPAPSIRFHSIGFRLCRDAD